MFGFAPSGVNLKGEDASPPEVEHKKGDANGVSITMDGHCIMCFECLPKEGDSPPKGHLFKHWVGRGALRSEGFTVVGESTGGFTGLVNCGNEV